MNTKCLATLHDLKSNVNIMRQINKVTNRVAILKKYTTYKPYLGVSVGVAPTGAIKGVGIEGG